MKTLTLTQPWASLVALGEKRIETRSWHTAYNGALAIHAALRYPKWAKDLALTEPFRTSLRVPHGNYSYPELTLGVVVCTTTLLYCVPTQQIVDKISDKERSFGDYSEGRWAWMFGPIVARFGMREVPVKGHLGLWDWMSPVTSHKPRVTKP